MKKLTGYRVVPYYVCQGLSTHHGNYPEFRFGSQQPESIYTPLGTAAHKYYLWPGLGLGTEFGLWRKEPAPGIKMPSRSVPDQRDARAGGHLRRNGEVKIDSNSRQEAIHGGGLSLTGW